MLLSPLAGDFAAWLGRKQIILFFNKLICFKVLILPAKAQS